MGVDAAAAAERYLTPRACVSLALRPSLQQTPEEPVAPDIPATEAKRLRNGRLTCLVCAWRPEFDTVAMLNVHRQGKKHLAGTRRRIFNGRRRSDSSRDAFGSFRARPGMGVAAVEAQAERAPLVDKAFQHQLDVAVALLDAAAAGPSTVRTPQTTPLRRGEGEGGTARARLLTPASACR